MRGDLWDRRRSDVEIGSVSTGIQSLLSGLKLSKRTDVSMGASRISRPHPGADTSTDMRWGALMLGNEGQYRSSRQRT
jgi:hypothetical protein